jgi:hypothetical protein
MAPVLVVEKPEYPERNDLFAKDKRIIVVVIVCKLDLQPPMQSEPITIKVVSSNPVHGKVYSIQHYVIKLSMTWGRLVFFSEYSGFLHK